jgi:predicted PurR-regulated permease PerM
MNRFAALDRLYRWLLITLLFPLVYLNGWLALRVVSYLQPLVTAFILAALLAFLLNYPVTFLEQRGMPRSRSVILVFLVTFLILAALGITLIPLLLEDLGEIADLLPQWFDSGRQQLQAFQDWGTNHRLPINISQVVGQVSDRLPDQLESLADKAGELALGAIGDASEALITVILTFYFLLDGQRISETLFQLLPARIRPAVQQALQQNFQNYFLGQVVLASLVGTLLTIAFLLLRLPYALLFGLGVGVLSVIPFGDIVSFSLLSLLLAAQDVWLGARVLVVAIVIDQIIDQIIAPRLLGRFTGLRPIWVLTALLVGAKIGGLLGLLLAVPLTSFLKTVIDAGFFQSSEAAESVAIEPLPDEMGAIENSEGSKLPVT